MADAHEALGQHMQQKAADEFVARQGQDLVAVAVAVVLVIELRLIFVEAQEACVR